MRLNCDLGEGLDEVDARVMPLIDMANIACGGHAGDANSIQRCVHLAKAANTWVGAHPAYPDRKNFGRISPKNPCLETLMQSLIAQLTWIKSACISARTPLKYVKPHGALYHDAAKTPEILQVLLKAMSHVCPDTPLMLQAQANDAKPAAWTLLEQDAAHNAQGKLTARLLWTEAFADRAYTPTGRLVTRSETGAVLASADEIVEQAKLLMQKGEVNTTAGTKIKIKADSLCVHGDTPAAFEALQKIQAWRMTQS